MARFWSMALLLCFGGCHLLLGNGRSASTDGAPGDTQNTTTSDAAHDSAVVDDAGPGLAPQPKLTNEPCNDGDWCWVNAIPQGSTLRDVWVSDQRVFVVGRFGTLLGCDLTQQSCKEPDHFRRLESPTRAHLYGVTGFNGKALAVGAGGTILRFDGAAWQRLAVPTPPTLHSYTLRAVEAVSRNEIYILGQLPGEDAGTQQLPASQLWLYDDDAGLLSPVPMVNTDPKVALTALAIVGPSDLVAVGEAGTALRYQSGLWSVLTTPVGAIGQNFLSAVIHNGTVYAGTSKGEVYFGAITSANWTKLTQSGLPQDAIYALVHETGAPVLRAYGNDGLAHKLDLQAVPPEPWSLIDPVASGSTLSFRAAYLAPSGDAYAVGVGGLMTVGDTITELNKGTKTFAMINDLAIWDRPEGLSILAAAADRPVVFGEPLIGASTGTPGTSHAVWATTDGAVWTLDNCEVYAYSTAGTTLSLPCSGLKVVAIAGETKPIVAAFNDLQQLQTPVSFYRPPGPLVQNWSAVSGVSPVNIDGKVTHFYFDTTANVWLAADPERTGAAALYHWNGQGWSEASDGPPIGSALFAIEHSENGNLFAVGLFENPGSNALFGAYTPASGWTWSLGSTLILPEPRLNIEPWFDLHSDNKGTVTVATETSVIQRAPGQAWNLLLTDIPGPRAVVVAPDGDIWVGGVNGTVLRWNSP